MRAKAAAIVAYLLIATSGCTGSIPGEPKCIEGVSTIEQLREKKPFTNFERMGRINIQSGTTSVTADEWLVSQEGPNDGEWIVDGPEYSSVFISIKPADSEKAKQLELKYSILSNHEKRDLYLQKGKCFSLLEGHDAVAFRENEDLTSLTLTVYTG